jgi:hypothetical protein
VGDVIGEVSDTGVSVGRMRISGRSRGRAGRPTGIAGGPRDRPGRMTEIAGGSAEGVGLRIGWY